MVFVWCLCGVRGVSVVFVRCLWCVCVVFVKFLFGVCVMLVTKLLP